ncbi:MAG TPA: tetratricopeptide repeat protein [Exilispira sp.]|nr:tetratricopeptide repeat protein [Exilispira sp.]
MDSQSREEFYFTKGKVLFDEEKYEQAIKSFDKALSLNPEHIMSNYLKSLALCKLNKIDEAIDHLNLVAEKTENFLIQQQVYLILGYIYSTKNNVELAIEYFEKVIGTGLEASAAYNALAALYHKKGDIKKAIENAKKALELKSDNYNAMNTLAYLLIDSNIDIEKGIQLAKKALAEEPNNPARLDTVGYGYLKLKNKTIAKEFLTKAYNINPNDVDIKKHLELLSKL